MGRENGGTMMGGGVVTPGHPKAWDHVNLKATLNSWHHVAMVGNTVYAVRLYPSFFFPVRSLAS